MATADKGDVQVMHAPEHGLVKVGIRPPLAVEYSEVVMPVEQFFAIVGESLHKVMAAQMQIRDKVASKLVEAPKPKIELVGR